MATNPLLTPALIAKLTIHIEDNGIVSQVEGELRNCSIVPMPIIPLMALSCVNSAKVIPDLSIVNHLTSHILTPSLIPSNGSNYPNDKLAYGVGVIVGRDDIPIDDVVFDANRIVEVGHCQGIAHGFSHVKDRLNMEVCDVNKVVLNESSGNLNATTLESPLASLGTPLSPNSKVFNGNAPIIDVTVSIINLRRRERQSEGLSSKSLHLHTPSKKVPSFDRSPYSLSTNLRSWILSSRLLSWRSVI
ncbi:hypothetical protein KFK09_000096 [Dendrobium nobile]|uniref:Uncharacterized protein n=1 Tax=Dendrobium nobile TaxID=94219 RepID=A0A8T3CAY3_DENNO|nr:hypothetical protein KFK09_000096 [Dendrobium nobile]